MNPEILIYNTNLTTIDKDICDILATIICENLPEAEYKVWHGHPVWFLDGNPIVGYAKRKNSVTLLFWSGQSFDESVLKNEGSFKAAQLDFTTIDQIDKSILIRLLQKSKLIQWDYKNIVKRKGRLDKLTEF